MIETLFRKLTLFAALLFWAFSNATIAAETGTAIKDDQLRAEPFTDAKTTAAVKRGETLTILKKQGVWLQVKNTKSTGWVKLLSVKRAGTSSTTASSSVLKQSSGRGGTGQIVSTTGIRGLSEDELKAAKFNETEIVSMESYTVSAKDAEQFAKAGQLKKVALAEITPAKSQKTANSAAQVMGGGK